jgi:hypothetical protein
VKKQKKGGGGGANQEGDGCWLSLAAGNSARTRFKNEGKKKKNLEGNGCSLSLAEGNSARTRSGYGIDTYRDLIHAVLRQRVVI